MPRVAKNIKGYRELHPHHQAFSIHETRESRRQSLQRFALNRPTENELRSFGLVLSFVKYHQSGHDRVTTYEYDPTFDEHYSSTFENEGVRVRWIQDPKDENLFVPVRSKPDSWIGVSITANIPGYITCDAGDQPVWVYSSSNSLDLDNLPIPKIYIIERLHSVMAETLVGIGRNTNIWYTPHGILEKFHYSAYKQRTSPADPIQETLMDIWRDARNLGEFPLGEDFFEGNLAYAPPKPLDLDIYQVENFGTISYAHEIQMLRISRAEKVNYIRGPDVPHEIQAVYASGRMRNVLNPPKKVLERARKRYIEMDKQLATSDNRS